MKAIDLEKAAALKRMHSINKIVIMRLEDKRDNQAGFRPTLHYTPVGGIESNTIIDTDLALTAIAMMQQRIEKQAKEIGLEFDE